MGGATLPDLLVDGEVSRDAVEVAVAQLLDDRPGLRRPAPFPDLGQGRRWLGPAAGPDWAALLNGREE